MQVATDTGFIPQAPHAAAGVPASLTEDTFLGGRLSILQPEKGYRAGIDAVFLAASIPVSAGETVFEAGIGVGVASMCLLARENSLHVTGMEINARYAMMCERRPAQGFGASAAAWVLCPRFRQPTLL
jgi:tRNA1(Val) A37 N6-methylase TrmN6